MKLISHQYGMFLSFPYCVFPPYLILVTFVFIFCWSVTLANPNYDSFNDLHTKSLINSKDIHKNKKYVYISVNMYSNYWHLCEQLSMTGEYGFIAHLSQPSINKPVIIIMKNTKRVVFMKLTLEYTS